MFGALRANAAFNAIKGVAGFGTLRQAGMGFRSAYKAAGGVRGIKAAGQGLGTIGLVGKRLEGARAGMRWAGQAGREYLGAKPRIGMGMRMGVGSIGKWATGGGMGRTGIRRAGVAAARVGGAGAAADFMNPWGLGWGD